MDRLHHKFTVNINSRDRVSGTSSDFYHEVDLPDQHPYNRVAVLLANIPLSMYTVASGKNVIVLDESGNLANVTLTPSNYSLTTLKIELAAQLNASSPLGWTYAVTSPNESTSPSTGKMTFTVTGNGGAQPTLTITNSYNLGQVLGFNDNSTNTFTGSSLDSTNVVNLSPLSTFQLLSNMCINGSDDLLQELYSNSIAYSSLVFSQISVEGNAKKLRSTTSNLYRFTLVDDSGDLIDLNGLDVQFSLIIYEKLEHGHSHEEKGRATLGASHKEYEPSKHSHTTLATL